MVQHHPIIENHDGDQFVLPELEAFGWNRVPIATPQLDGHRHRRVYELCVISKGEVIWWVGDEIYRVGKGEIYMTWPNEKHGGVDSMLHACELYFLQIAFPSRGALPGLTSPQTRLLARKYRQLRHRHFTGSPAVIQCFARIVQAHRVRDDYSQIRARAALHELLVLILQDHDRAADTRPGRDADKSEVILQALRWIDDHVEADHYVKQIAQAVGLSVSRFHERFVDEVGLSPGEYRMRRRVEQAKPMLYERDRSVTDIAMCLGFSTSQYFATVFRKYTGLSPRAYRRAVCDDGRDH